MATSRRTTNTTAASTTSSMAASTDTKVATVVCRWPGDVVKLAGLEITAETPVEVTTEQVELLKRVAPQGSLIFARIGDTDPVASLVTSDASQDAGRTAEQDTASNESGE